MQFSANSYAIVSRARTLLDGRGDWGAPGNHAGNSGIAVNPCQHSLSAGKAAAEMVAVFRGARFELRHTLECFVGEPERPLFAYTGKERFFDAAHRVPAIMISHFRRCSPRIGPAISM